MKRIVFFISLLIFIISPLAAQDTVRMENPWYSPEANNPLGSLCNMAHGMPNDWAFFWNEGQYYRAIGTGDDLFKMSVIQDTGDYLYGIAVTAYNFPVHVEGQDMDPIMGLYVVNDSVARQEGGWTPIRIYDSLCLTNVRRDCYFDYELGNPEKPDTHIVVPTTELYFDTPYRRASLPDTIFLSLCWTDSRKQNYKNWVAGHCSSPNITDCLIQPVVAKMTALPTSLFFMTSSVGSDVLWEIGSYDRVAVLYPYVTSGGYTASSAFWGCIFPIKNLRCTAPHVYLAGREGNDATVRWWQAEAGEAYQLSLGAYGSDPDSGLLATPADTFHTFTGLQPDAIYQVWMRKACRYTTAGYDTLVWSAWSHPLTFRASVGIDEVDDDGLRVTVQGGCIAVQGLAPGERAEVYDMKGCRVALLPADGNTQPLPQGVYLLRMLRHDGVQHRRVVVTAH